MTKTTFRFFFHFSFLFLKFHSFTPTAFSISIHQNNKISDLPCFFHFIVWSMSGGTEPKLEPMLDFNESAKTTESSKPHIFLFISMWFDIN